MSVFDPYALYKRQQKNTHEGQIIRKKLVEHPGPVSREDINKFIKLLRGQGYYVFRPLENPFYFFDSQYMLGFFTIADANAVLNPGEEMTINFSHLWNVVKDQYSRVLNHQSSDIIDFGCVVTMYDIRTLMI